MTAPPEPAGRQSEASIEDVAAFGTRRPRLGAVETFDAERGLGTVVTAGGASFGFHSAAITGGSRRIAAGTRVVFSVAAAVDGRFDAVEVMPLDGGARLSAAEDRAGGPG